MAWELRKNGKPITEPGPLPQNWGPIQGLAGFEDILGDLSWLGEKYAGMAWVQVDDPQPTAEDKEREALEEVRRLLSESGQMMLPDVPLTAGERQEWMEYRQALRDLHKQPEFPHRIDWPREPEAGQA